MPKLQSRLGHGRRRQVSRVMWRMCVGGGDGANGEDVTGELRIVVCLRFRQCHRLNAGRVVWRLDDGAKDKFMANDCGFCVRGSACDDRCLGIEKRMSLRIMRNDIPLLNSSTWRRMYLRKASDDHRPMSMIM